MIVLAMWADSIELFCHETAIKMLANWIEKSEWLTASLSHQQIVKYDPKSANCIYFKPSNLFLNSANQLKPLIMAQKCCLMLCLQYMSLFVIFFLINMVIKN